MVTLTMTDAPTHGLPGHAGVGAGVVGLMADVLAVLVGIITPHRCVTRRGHGQLPTLSADSTTIFVQGAALPAAVLIIIIVGLDCVRSAVAVCILVDALIPTQDSTRIVVAGVGVAGDRGVTRVFRPHCHQQQQGYCGLDLHT